MAALYVKDLNWINYGVLTCGYFYFSKQIESYLIKKDKEHAKLENNQGILMSIIDTLRKTLIFDDKLVIEKNE